MNTSEVLYKAADHIERYGHFQGGSSPASDTSEHPACSVDGAIRHVVSGNGGWEWRALRVFERHLPIPSVVVWNDAPERTQEEVVVATLRAVAAQEAKKEKGL